MAGPVTEAMLMYYQDHENIKEGAWRFRLLGLTWMLCMDA